MLQEVAMLKRNSLSNERLLLNLQMFIDELDGLYVEYEPGGDISKPLIYGCELYTGRNKMRSDTLYIVTRHLVENFPADEFAYVTNEHLNGKAPHASSISLSNEDLLNTVLEIVTKYRNFEDSLNRVIISGGSLDDLCLVGIDFFGNPMYVHDNLFCILSRPVEVHGMLELDVSAETGKRYIPLWLVNEFKFDDDYQHTLEKRSASIWGNDQYPTSIRSLFVNIMDGDYYMGRLLINEINSSLMPGQFRTAEFFADYVKYIIWRDSHNSNRYYNDFSETINRALDGMELRNSEKEAFLSIMGWKPEDSYLCVKLQSQRSDVSIRSEGSLRNSISSNLHGFFCFTRNQQFCLIINKKDSGIDEAKLSSILAPLVRDGLMYCGVSNPFKPFDDFVQGFVETDIALDAIKENPTKWILTFDACVLDYILKNSESSINKRMLVAPGLMRLAESDEKKGTQYVHTLRSYLVNERSVPKTSEELIIHRTTLLYRLEKISELLKMNLESPDTRLYLLICFKMMGM